MNDNDQKEKNLRGIPGDLDERSKTDLREVWDIAGLTAESDINRLPDLTDAEIESALSQVQQRLGLASAAAITSDGSEPIYSSDSDHNTDAVRSSETRHRLVPARTPMWLFMRLSAAAAVLLMAYGTYWAATPVRYEAPYGQRLTIELPDGSLAELNSGSTLAHSRIFGWKNRAISVEGEIWLEVRRDPAVFSVSTPNARIEVTGTEFLVRYWSTDPDPTTDVYLNEGSVRFTASGNNDAFISLTAGQHSSIGSGAITPSDPVQYSSEQIFAWRKGHMAYVNTPLDAIFRELERRYDVRISHDLPTLANRTLSTFYNSERNIESVLDDICIVHGLSYTKVAGGYRIGLAP
jgi:transmembrane sensor